MGYTGYLLNKMLIGWFNVKKAIKRPFIKRNAVTQSQSFGFNSTMQIPLEIILINFSSLKIARKIAFYLTIIFSNTFKI